MKNLINRALAAEKKLLILLAAAIMAIGLTSCSDAKYTVWTDTETYMQFTRDFSTTLEDGYYKKLEITNEQWQQIAPSLTNEGKHRWSEAEIKKWLMDYGFGENEAAQESSWLVMTNHCILFIRGGDFVYMILK